MQRSKGKTLTQSGIKNRKIRNYIWGHISGKGEEPVKPLTREGGEKENVKKTKEGKRKSK